MPFKSKAQQRWMFWAEKHDKLPKGTAEEWAEHTPSIKKLPERVKKTKKTASDEREDSKNPDLPQFKDPESMPWTQGSQLEGNFQKVSFIGGLLKTAKSFVGASMKSLAGTTEMARQRHNTDIIKRMAEDKPLYSLTKVKSMFPQLAQKVTKVAEASMSYEANQQSGWSIGDYMPGERARNNAVTGQGKQKNYRTEGVQNENREMKKSLKHNEQTARGGKSYGSFYQGFQQNSQD
jgi:hypothetical protein